MIYGLHHVNVVTDDLEHCARLYERLGLQRGPRPPFPPIGGIPNEGIWMYCGPNPIVHLNKPNIESDTGPAAIDHVGFKVRGSVEDVAANLRVLGIDFDLWDPVPGCCRALYFRGVAGEKIEFVLVDCYVAEEDELGFPITPEPFVASVAAVGADHYEED